MTSLPATTATVCKLGGSLLTLNDLRDRLARLIANLGEKRPLLIVGGGAAADVVRDWDRRYQLSPERAHWLAIQAMGLNEAIVQELIPAARLVARRDEAEAAWNQGHAAILNAYQFLRAEEREGGECIPHSWDVTSDSIAAWIAIRWPAERLVLVKSVPPPTTRSNDAVDRHFNQLAPHIARIDWVNLRDDDPVVETYARRSR